MQKKNIILISVDALRADHLGCYGYKRNISPNLDQISKEGIRFYKAFSNAPYTMASIKALLTSTYPLVPNRNYLNFDDKLTLPQYLKEIGYYTIGIHSNPWFSIYKLDKLFDFFKDPMKSPTQKMAITYPYTEAGEINNEVINQLKNINSNFFLWIHYMDVHEPYFTPEHYFVEKINNKQIQGLMDKKVKQPSKLTDKERETIINLYDDGIRYVDKKIEELIEELAEVIDLTNTIIIITSDHGDGLGEKGYYGHGGAQSPCLLNDDILQIPLVVWSNSKELVSQIRKDLNGAQINNQVGLIDVAPFILSVLGINSPQSFMGESPCDSNEKILISQGIRCRDPNSTKYLFDGTPKHSIRSNNYKLIVEEGNGIELYDLINDPDETNNIYNENQLIANRLKERLFKELNSHTKN